MSQYVRITRTLVTTLDVALDEYTPGSTLDEIRSVEELDGDFTEFDVMTQTSCEVEILEGS